MEKYTGRPAARVVKFEFNKYATKNKDVGYRFLDAASQLCAIERCNLTDGSDRLGIKLTIEDKAIFLSEEHAIYITKILDSFTSNLSFPKEL